MNKLKGAICYLSGPMEDAKDMGVEWRRKIIKLFKENGVYIACIDPTNKPVEDKFEEDVTRNKRLKEQESWDELVAYVKAFRRKDLRFVDLSDFIIALVDPKIHLCGTYNEIFEAERQKKPRFAIIDGGLKNLPSWLFAVFPLSCIFSSVEECVEHIRKLNSGELPLNDNWVLIREKLNEHLIQS
jgi:hypothetical protein